MRRFIGLIVLGTAILMPLSAFANCEVQTSNLTYANGTNLGGDVCGVTGGRKVEQSTLLAGEDQTNNVIRIERQPLRTVTTADTLVLTGAGRISSIVCWGSDAAATAGTIDILDATAAGGTPKILSFPIAQSLLLPTVVAGVDIPVTTGIYVDYTTTNDVSCTVLYRPEGVAP